VEYENELRRIAERCRAPDCRVVFLVWPLRWQMDDGPEIAKQEVVRELAAELGAGLVDLVPVFRARGGARLFADVVHADEEGHRRVADELEPVLRRLLGEAGAGRSRVRGPGSG
jgi:hypothetical protein